MLKKYRAITGTLFFVSGIILRYFYQLPFFFYLILTIALIAFFTFFYFKKRTSKFYTVVKFATINLAFLLLGITTLSIHSISRQPIPISDKYIKHSLLYGKIENVELMHNEKFRILIKSDSISVNEKDTSYTLKKKHYDILCTVSDTINQNLSNLFNTLKPGNKVQVFGSLSKGREAGNPGEFNYRNYLENRGINGIFYATSTDSIIVLNKQTSLFANFFFQARKSCSAKIDKIFSPETAPFVKGLVIADRAEIEPETIQNFMNAGVMHVIAVSGLHITILAFMIIILVGRFHPYTKYALTAVLILFFTFFTESPAPVLRATVMTLTFLFTRGLNRHSSAINSMAISALIVLLINPYELFNAGFQLSYGAVAALLLAMPSINEWTLKRYAKKKVRKFLILFTATSTVAQVGTIPFGLYYFGKFTLLFLPANFFIIPASNLILINSIIAILLSYISESIAVIVGHTSNIITYLSFRLIKIIANTDFSILRIHDYNGVDAAIFISFIIIGLVLYSVFESKMGKTLLIIAISLNIFAFTGIFGKKILPANRLTMISINVGQGDSFLIHTPEGKNILIDAGKRFNNFDTGTRTIIPLLSYLGISKIDYLFISHTDNDHYGGVFSLIDTGLVSVVYKPESDTNLEKDRALDKFLLSKHIEVHTYSPEILSIGSVQLYFFDDSDEVQYDSKSNNDRSGVFQLVYGDTRFLFTGDAGKPREEVLINDFGALLESDVLKVGHHGSKHSSGDDFIEIVKPNLSIISAGIDNRYGHPAKEVLEQLLRDNSTIYRTDYEGAIVLQSDGKKIEKVNWNTPLKLNKTEKVFN